MKNILKLILITIALTGCQKTELLNLDNCIDENLLGSWELKQVKGDRFPEGEHQVAFTSQGNLHFYYLNEIVEGMSTTYSVKDNVLTIGDSISYNYLIYDKFLKVSEIDSPESFDIYEKL